MIIYFILEKNRIDPYYREPNRWRHFHTHPIGQVCGFSFQDRASLNFNGYYAMQVGCPQTNQILELEKHSKLNTEFNNLERMYFHLDTYRRLLHMAEKTSKIPFTMLSEDENDTLNGFKTIIQDAKDDYAKITKIHSLPSDFREFQAWEKERWNEIVLQGYEKVNMKYGENSLRMTPYIPK